MRSSTRGVFAMALAATAAAATAAPVSAAVPRQRSEALFTTSQPGAPTGVRLSIDYLETSPSGKPHSVSRVAITLADGTRVDTSVPARCDASAIELMLMGTSACPEDSRVGGGRLSVDSGFPTVALPRVIENAVTFFNADGQLILFTESTNTAGPPIRTATFGSWKGAEVSFDVPPIPGLPPPEPFIAVKTVRVALDPITRGGGTYLTTPTSCPAAGTWLNRETFRYSDGVSETVPTRVPCQADERADDRASPRIALRGVPRRSCVRHDFTLRVRAADASGLGLVRVRLDRRVIHTTRRGRFSLRVHAARLRPGRHRVRVSASDGAGNRATRAVRFRRCGR